MGKTLSSLNHQQWSMQLQDLQLSETEISFLHRSFCGGKVLHLNTLPIDVLVANLGIKGTELLAYQIFAIYDVGDSQRITFSEFVLALWRFCTQPAEHLGDLIFDLYDSSCHGSLPLSVLRKILQDIHAGSVVNITATMQNAIQEMGSRAERNELVSSENFNEVLNQHKGLLYPAYRLQIQMRQKFFGRKYWENKIIQKTEEDTHSSRSDCYRSALSTAALADRNYIDQHWFSPSAKLNSFKRTYSAAVQPLPSGTVLSSKITDNVSAPRAEDASRIFLNERLPCNPPIMACLKPISKPSRAGKYLSPFTLKNLMKSRKIRLKYKITVESLIAD